MHRLEWNELSLMLQKSAYEHAKQYNDRRRTAVGVVLGPFQFKISPLKTPNMKFLLRLGIPQVKKTSGMKVTKEILDIVLCKLYLYGTYE